MTTTVYDHDSVIEICLVPQTIAEAALLMRLGKNTKKNDISVRSYFIGQSIDSTIRIQLKARKDISIGNGV